MTMYGWVPIRSFATILPEPPVPARLSLPGMFGFRPLCPHPPEGFSGRIHTFNGNAPDFCLKALIGN